MFIVKTALESGLQRGSIFVGIGGGVICDMTAFASSIFKRGAGLELVPTTLLAMVDAAVGGKTGCDFENYKNMIGTFYPASRLHVFGDFLQSLPESEYRSGLAETLKTALLYAPKLFHILQTQKEDVMERTPELIRQIIRHALEMPDFKEKIEFNNVTFSYIKNGESNNEVLNNVTFDIKKGETIALVGPTGAGKSTICHLLPRFYEIDEGEILVDGTDIRDLTRHSLRKNIGIVAQDVFLFAGTIYDNIIYGNLEATFEEVVEAAKKANIYDFVMTLDQGFDTYVGERGVKLSGGQKQRISIARAFLKNPDILILDEATSALDNVTEMQIQKALEELSTGRTTIVVAHRLSTVKNANKIIVISKNGIDEEGTHEELLALNGIYANLYQYQFK